MDKNKFKFKLGEKVFILGKNGCAVVMGRGVLESISGGKINLYQIQGAHNCYVPESILLSFKEEKQLLVDSKF